ncbi:hypothetical protein NM688_g5447 [Phlebia brevispora]|uniref:Uncharacterized protein n=1 Tax=Phlebia brevispora TaxID=194682 RepID=A0ACC1SVC7_9APHY|nr:hypothetical protein NM688_g5447 [Phlebia brevispora]
MRINYWAEYLTKQEHAGVTKRRREVVIYSEEIPREDAHLDVPLQLKHTTTNPVIPSSLADQPCAALGVDVLLKNLNEVLRTSYSLGTPGLLPVLKDCIERKYDFGTALGRLRRFWFGDFELLPLRLAELGRQDREMRAAALDEEKGIIKRNIMPRRVWDMYSNRVLPIFVLGNTDRWWAIVWAISHSWMAEDSRHPVPTSINGFEWRVPLPKDTSLDRIRVELLNLGAEYVWLDVLCLRQEDSLRPEKEEMRKREWLLDVPTIGYIYYEVDNVVTYFEGLGRPFHISDISSPRHWLNRAWTLQETDPRTFIGGLTPTSPFPPNAKHLDATAKQFYTAFAKMIQDIHRGGNLLHLIQIMDKRSASFEVDKIAGLAYLTGSDALPRYIRSEGDEAAQAEAAWTHLVRTMNINLLIPLIFLYPAPGDWEYTWMPTWHQLKSGAPPLPHTTFDVDVRSWLYSGPHRLDVAHVLVLCTIQGLGEPDAQQRCRRGTLTVEVEDRGSGSRAERFVVTAHHQHPIPDSERYTLVSLFTAGTTEQDLQYWMVGTHTSSGAIRKVSVLEMEDMGDRERLEKLGLAKFTRDVPLE